MTLEEKIRLIAQEFSGKETTPKTNEKLQRLEQRRITPNSVIPKRRFLFEMFDKPCFARGELVGITGRAKSGKTFFTSMLMALGVSEATAMEDACKIEHVLSDESFEAIKRHTEK